jgi:hypothetical protein
MALLRPEHAIWCGRRHFWVFRGVEDDGFNLLPKALRLTPRAQLGYTFSPKVGRQATNALQIEAEFERLHEFFWTADAQGLDIPGDSHLVRTPAGWRQMEAQRAAQGWPPDELLPLIALAQHYGVATRLLDWTDKPLVAAHFAAKKAAQQSGTGSTHVGLWALDFDWIIHRAWPGNGNNILGLVVTAPRASNPNLHAQGGIFTTEKIVVRDRKKATHAVPIDQLVVRRHRELGGRKATVMCHFRLPAGEAPTLLRLLHREGVDSATLFPGYQGVADSLTDRQYWDAKERVNFWLK